MACWRQLAGAMIHKHMKLTSFPRPVPLERYEVALDRVVGVLARQPGVLAVYQVGGIRTPGISDIDLFVIFADGVRCSVDPLSGLQGDDLYLFPHGQFGLCRRHFELAGRYPFFHDFRLRWGEVIEPAPADLTPDETRLVHFQTGLEYLLKMYISMTIEQAYGIARVRNLLLLGRALLYDLEYVGITAGRSVELVSQIVDWREAWFRQPPSREAITAWFGELHTELRRLLGTLFAQQRFYAPPWADLRIAMSAELVPAARFGCEHSGLTLPAVFAGLGRRYFNLQHRFNRFRFQVPVEDDPAGQNAVLLQRHELVTEMTEYNRVHLPHFTPVSTALNMFRRRVPA